MRIAVLDLLYFKNNLIVYKFFDNLVVCVEYKLACILSANIGKFTCEVNRFNAGKIVFLADSCVVLTECGSNMNDTCTCIKRYIIVSDYIESLFRKCANNKGVYRLIFLADKV